MNHKPSHYDADMDGNRHDQYGSSTRLSSKQTHERLKVQKITLSDVNSGTIAGQNEYYIKQRATNRGCGL